MVTVSHLGNEDDGLLTGQGNVRVTFDYVPHTSQWQLSYVGHP